jgi:hypothetical protein
MNHKKEDLWVRSLTLIHEFERYIHDHPRFADRIPYGAQVVLLPTYDDELRRYNFQNAEMNREKGQPVIFVEIDELLPARSRIRRLKIKTEASSRNVPSRRQRKRTVSTPILHYDKSSL